MEGAYCLWLRVKESLDFLKKKQKNNSVPAVDLCKSNDILNSAPE